MSLLFFYDTETSGLPDWKSPSEAEHQPHIVQAAGAIVDSESRETIASVEWIAKPDGWVIPDEVAAIHGITTERALQEVGQMLCADAFRPRQPRTVLQHQLRERQPFFDDGPAVVDAGMGLL